MTGSETPKFRKPPVVEVAIGLQFEPLERLRVAHLGLLWSRYRDRYPTTEHHFPISPVTEPVEEVFGQPEHRFEPRFPVPRCWFVTGSGTQLIQVQQDRFLVNWRRLDTGEDYPSYRKIRRVFGAEFDKFSEFVAGERLGEIRPDYCEVTYVNHLPKGHGWDRAGQVDRVLAPWVGKHSDTFLSEPQDVDVGIRYTIRERESDKPVGRLNAKLNPAIRRSDSMRVLVLNITARARIERIESDILGCLDLCHEWAVKGFVSITSETMHALWERIR